jgi:Type IV pilin-like G and H, putative
MIRLNLYRLGTAIFFIAGIILVMRFWGLPLAEKFVKEQHHQWYIRKKKPRSMLSIINGSQSRFFIKNHFFANSFKDLETGILQDDRWYEDPWYIYSMNSNNRMALIYMVPKKMDLNSYVGAVFAVFDANEKLTLLSIQCETKSSGIIQPAEPRYQAGQLVCGEGSNIMFRE